MPYTIMIDAGHGGADPGAVYKGRQEKDDNLRLALAVGQILQNHGIDVEYTRTEDIYESPSQKAMEANQAMPEFFVSIHRNSFPTPNAAEGIETLVYNDSGLKAEMARNINQQLETIGFVNHGVRVRPNLTVLRRTRMPALLVEAGFINSDTDNRIFDENFDAIAQAIASGIIDTLEGGHTENPRQSGGAQSGGMQSGMRESSGTQPGGVQRGMRESGGTQPGSVQSGMRQSGGTQSGNMQSGMRESGGAQPGGMQSGMEQSGGAHSGSMQSGTEQSDGAQPGSRQMDADMRGNVQTGGGQQENAGSGGMVSEEPRTEMETGGHYRVQVGAFRNQAYANNLLRELKEQEYPARIEDSGGFYRVVVGSFQTLQEAAQMEQRLKWSGYPTIVIS